MHIGVSNTSNGLIVNLKKVGSGIRVQKYKRGKGAALLLNSNRETVQQLGTGAKPQAKINELSDKLNSLSLRLQPPKRKKSNIKFII